MRVLMILAAAASASAIRVPVYEDPNHSASDNVENVETKPAYYTTDDAEIDSYVVPPSPHTEAGASGEDTPATYLLPPPAGPFEDFYTAREGTQSDWLPMTEPVDQPSQEEITPEKKVPLKKTQFQLGKKKPVVLEKLRNKVPRPSRVLEPPDESPSEFFVAPSNEQELPIVSVEQPFKHVAAESQTNVVTQRHAMEPIIVQIPLEHSEPIPLHLMPPRPLPAYNFPTKFPKKYQPFKPVPIPLAEYLDASAQQVPLARPAPAFTPALAGYPGYPGLYDEKQAYLRQQAVLKRKFKEAEAAKLLELQQADAAAAREPPAQPEPRPPGRPAPPRRAPAEDAPAPKERTEFRMHGMKGPHSYQFGFDTGKGKNRQFRYEERDNDGRVKGHYGYVERDGKLRVVNYNADPDTGFHADAAPVDKEPETE